MSGVGLRRIIIGLTGPNGSGKGEVSNYLKKRGFTYHSLSDVIRDVATTRALEHSRENLRVIGNELREKGGSSVLAKMIIEKIESKNETKAIVDSIRNPEEAKELLKHEGFFLLGVNAPVEVRFDRAMKRNRNENAQTLEEFKNMEEKENSASATGQQLNNTYALRQASVMNDSTLEKLEKQIDEILSKQFPGLYN